MGHRVFCFDVGSRDFIKNFSLLSAPALFDTVKPCRVKEPFLALGARANFVEEVFADCIPVVHLEFKCTDRPDLLHFVDRILKKARLGHIPLFEMFYGLYK